MKTAKSTFADSPRGRIRRDTRRRVRNGKRAFAFMASV
jgi:hypothetical protein